MITITFGICPYDNEQNTIKQINAVIIPTINAYQSKYTFDIICVDNSTKKLIEVENTLKHISNIKTTYIWNKGENKLLADSTNKAIKNSTSDLFVYVCSNHGKIYDMTWFDDLIEPLLKNDNAAMSGNIIPYTYDCIHKCNDGVPEIHVQGGVFACKTKILQKIPYEIYEHSYMDVWISWKLQKEGYSLCHVPTIWSALWAGDSLSYKYIHDTIANI